jgi:hypothetical protein
MKKWWRFHDNQGTELQKIPGAAKILSIDTKPSKA